MHHMWAGISSSLLSPPGNGFSPEDARPRKPRAALQKITSPNSNTKINQPSVIAYSKKKTTCATAPPVPRQESLSLTRSPLSSHDAAALTPDHISPARSVSSVQTVEMPTPSVSVAPLASVHQTVSSFDKCSATSTVEGTAVATTDSNTEADKSATLAEATQAIATAHTVMEAAVTQALLDGARAELEERAAAARAVERAVAEAAAWKAIAHSKDAVEQAFAAHVLQATTDEADDLDSLEGLESRLCPESEASLRALELLPTVSSLDDPLAEDEAVREADAQALYEMLVDAISPDLPSELPPAADASTRLAGALVLALYVALTAILAAALFLPPPAAVAPPRRQASPLLLLVPFKGWMAKRGVNIAPAAPKPVWTHDAALRAATLLDEWSW